MKIERVNDRQIRCTLTGDDLATRQLKISELAYGSEKAKSLFRDMMQQAEYEFGFEAEDIPLVIEAIPVNADCIILIITKVDDPEELDTRFSRFAPSVREGDANGEDGNVSFAEGGQNAINAFAEDMINMLREVKASIERRGTSSDNIVSGDNTESDESASDNMLCTLTCDSLGTLADFARVVAPYYKEPSTLYKTEQGQYLLLLTSGKLKAKEFALICNTGTEFGTLVNLTDSRYAYIKEHHEVIIKDNAVEGLSKI